MKKVLFLSVLLAALLLVVGCAEEAVEETAVEMDASDGEEFSDGLDEEEPTEEVPKDAAITGQGYRATGFKVAHYDFDGAGDVIIDKGEFDGANYLTAGNAQTVTTMLAAGEGVFDRNKGTYLVKEDFQNFPRTTGTWAFWLKLDEDAGSAGVISYSVGRKDRTWGRSSNEFLLYYGQPSTRHPNGLFSVTVDRNGGKRSKSGAGFPLPEDIRGGWHHIAVVWAKNNGEAWFYVDGERIGYSGKSKVAKRRNIGRDGTLVIGNDQDCRFPRQCKAYKNKASFKGGFDAKQALKGRIDDLRIYDYKVDGTGSQARKIKELMDLYPKGDCGNGVADEGETCTICMEDVCEAGQTCVNDECFSCEAAVCTEGQCGAIDDGCGGTVECGECSGGLNCVESVCGCEPRECPLGWCGEVDDRCGGTIDCGGCGEGGICISQICNDLFVGSASIDETFSEIISFGDSVYRVGFVQRDFPDSTGLGDLMGDAVPRMRVHNTVTPSPVLLGTGQVRIGEWLTLDDGNRLIVDELSTYEIYGNSIWRVNVHMAEPVGNGQVCDDTHFCREESMVCYAETAERSTCSHREEGWQCEEDAECFDGRCIGGRCGSVNCIGDNVGDACEVRVCTGSPVQCRTEIVGSHNVTLADPCIISDQCESLDEVCHEAMCKVVRRVGENCGIRHQVCEDGTECVDGICT